MLWVEWPVDTWCSISCSFDFTCTRMELKHGHIWLHPIWPGCSSSRFYSVKSPCICLVYNNLSEALVLADGPGLRQKHSQNMSELNAGEVMNGVISLVQVLATPRASSRFVAPLTPGGYSRQEGPGLVAALSYIEVFTLCPKANQCIVQPLQFTERSRPSACISIADVWCHSGFHEVAGLGP